MESIFIIEGNQEVLDRVKPLWEKLNEHHKSNATYFVKRYEEFTFDKRKESLLKKIKYNAMMHIGLAIDSNKNMLVGYCISTVDKESIGEIESIYIDELYRGYGIGDKLIRKALSWMESLSVKKKLISVAVGNEQAFYFYARYGFYPCVTMLEQR